MAAALRVSISVGQDLQRAVMSAATEQDLHVITEQAINILVI